MWRGRGATRSPTAARPTVGWEGGDGGRGNFFLFGWGGPAQWKEVLLLRAHAHAPARCTRRIIRPPRRNRARNRLVQCSQPCLAAAAAAAGYTTSAGSWCIPGRRPRRLTRGSPAASTTTRPRRLRWPTSGYRNFDKTANVTTRRTRYPPPLSVRYQRWVRKSSLVTNSRPARLLLTPFPRPNRVHIRDVPFTLPGTRSSTKRLFFSPQKQMRKLQQNVYVCIRVMYAHSLSQSIGLAGRYGPRESF